MQALVRHLHGFAVEVSLTDEEWRAMIGVLTDTGQITDEKRQEFIPWSDTLGLSMLVDALAHELPAGATESTVLGPFYVPGAPPREYGESMVATRGPGVPAGYAGGCSMWAASRSPALSSTSGRTGRTRSMRRTQTDHQRSRGSGSRSRTTSCWSPETITARWLIRGGPRSRVVFRRNALRPRA
jgi:hypothetical protein